MCDREDGKNFVGVCQRFYFRATIVSEFWSWQELPDRSCNCVQASLIKNFHVESKWSFLIWISVHQKAIELASRASRAMHLLFT